MSITTNLDNIEYFALNLCNLTKLNPVELLLVQDKISSREIVKINNSIDGDAILLKSTIRGYDYRNSHKQKQISQLKATCELIWEHSRVRSYYSKTGKKFYPLRFN